MAHADAFFPRNFTVDSMFPFEMDMKSGLLSDPAMPLALSDQPELHSAHRMEDFFAPHGAMQRSSFDEDAQWAADDLEVPSSADSCATAPTNPFPSAAMMHSPILRSPAFTPASMMRHVSLASPEAAYHMGPIAAPITTFPSIDLQTFRRPKIEPLETSIPASQESAPAELPHDTSIESSSSSPTSARAVRAASRHKRAGSPSEEPEFEVPSASPVRADARRKRPVERQAARNTLDAQLSEEERLEKNRQSARDCRLRKKRYIESLERRLAEADKRETVLTQTIARLEEQIAALTRKH